MSLHQAYYTSCQMGWSGEGFQFNALSPSLDRGLLSSLVDFCQYEPPPSQPSVPTEEELEGFPVNFFYQLLAGGGAVLGREVYVGKGFDGRFGNFFAHLLVADSAFDDLASSRPIEFWRSPTWVRTPSPERDLPEPGPPVSRSQILNPDYLDQFFQDPERESYLPAFFTAVENALATGRRIVLVESESEEIARWVALATLILPAHLVLRFSFCTYHKNPERSGALLVGTTADSQFQFAPQQIRFQYFVLDFVKGRFSPAVETSSFGAALYKAWQTGGVRALSKFAERLGALAPDVEPADLSDLSLFAAGDLSCIGQGDRSLKFLRWCKHLAPERWDAPADLARLFRESVRGGAARDEVVAAAAKVHQDVAARYQAHREVAAHFDAAFEEWMTSEVCEQATTASLVGTVSMLATHADTPSDLPRDCWRAALEEALSREPARALALLEMGQALGWLGKVDFPHAAVAAAAAALVEMDRVQALLVGGTNGPLREVLLSACAEHVTQLPAQRAEPPALAALLRNPHLAGPLTERAHQRGDFALACRLRLAAPGTSDRVELLRECLADPPRWNLAASLPGATNPLDFAYTLIWGTVVPTLSDAAAILEIAARPESYVSLPAETSLAVAACSRCLESELARSPGSRRAEAAAEQERVAAQLEKLGIRFPSAKALMVRAELRAWPLLRPLPAASEQFSDTKALQAIEAALTLSTSPSLPAALQEEVQTLAGRALVSVRAPQKQRQVLESGAALRTAARQSFIAGYADAAFTALEGSPRSTWLAALLFTIWHSMDRPPAARIGTGLLASLRKLFPDAERARAARFRKIAAGLKKDVLRRALLHWDRGSRERVREQLTTTALRIDWDLWERANCPPGFRGWVLRRLDKRKPRRPMDLGGTPDRN